MAATLVEDAALHRLWYDLRNQSLFDERFRADVTDIDQSLERMIWRIVAAFGELSQSPPAVSQALAYALLDGVFQHALLRHLGGDVTAAAALEEDVRQVLPTLLGQ